MKQLQPEGQEKYQDQDKKLIYQKKLQKSLKSVIKLLPFVEFTVNYGFAIENVWITMLMITHQTPNIVDSFVWTAPVVIAILARPYIVRHVHSISYTVYREVTAVSFFLILGALGCFLVGLSCDLHRKSQIFRRIFQCSLGWTLMDLSFEFCQFFSQKIQASYKQLHQSESINNKAEDNVEIIETEVKKQKVQFFGLLLGYFVGLLICWLVQGTTVKQFYKSCKYSYWTVAVLALIMGIRLYIESETSLPKRQEFIEKDISQKPLQISTELPYYLPGLQQLKRSDKRTFTLLILHFSVIFLNDIIMIYTTMWFTQPSEIEFQKPGEALTAGLQYGSMALIIYTVISNLNIKLKFLTLVNYFELTMIAIVLFSLFTFYNYSYHSFTGIVIFIAIFNQFYIQIVYNIEIESNPVFQRCTEIIDRLQKIFVLAIMPSIVLLILGRDDIQDCLFWLTGVLVLGLCAYNISRRVDRVQQRQQKHQVPIEKVTKIE